jgi:hypothetical protein
MKTLKPVKRDGWKITCDGEYICLTYSPDVLGEFGAAYLVNEEVYKRALDPDIGLKQLIKEFNIFSNFKKIYDIKKPLKLSPKESTPTKFYGRGFIAAQEGEKYFLEYQLARHGGGSRKFEISKEIYEDARKGDKSTSDLFKKYNLYHFDIPENDVK